MLRLVAFAMIAALSTTVNAARVCDPNCHSTAKLTKVVGHTAPASSSAGAGLSGGGPRGQSVAMTPNADESAAAPAAHARHHKAHSEIRAARPQKNDQ